MMERAVIFTQFEAGLENLIGRPSLLRPFVCDGSPLDCRVFVVGINPATSMTEDFWSFWRPGVGFDKTSWYEAYKRHRAQLPLKPGRTRRHAVSSTRRILDLVVEAATPVRCLETNLFGMASAAASDLPMNARSTEVLDFLLPTIKPELVVAHGSGAAAYVTEHVPGAEVWTVSHFSRGWSFDEARKLGTRIRSHTAGARGGLDEASR